MSTAGPTRGGRHDLVQRLAQDVPLMLIEGRDPLADHRVAHSRVRVREEQGVPLRP